MKEKMYYLVGDTQDGKNYEKFNSYNEAMVYIKEEYLYEKEHENDGKANFIDGFYGIYSISEETAEYYGWDYVMSDFHAMNFLGIVYYNDVVNYDERIKQ